MSLFRRFGRVAASSASRVPLSPAQRLSQRNILITSLNTPDECFEAVRERSPHQREFLQAVKEVIDSLDPLFKRYPQYTYILPCIAEPERVIQFRVPWVNDRGHTHINRGFRVQFNQALGPYKGGLRFHKTVNSSIIKFLGFEQIFKNALTGLAMGGAKGGSDFNPKGKSEAEIMRFCQSFMTELMWYIGPEQDVPAGDIGVGGREIGYLFGQWKRMTSKHQGVLTGKGILWGGSHIRPEATGYGLVYFTETALNDVGDSVAGKRCAISGSGNVAEFTAEKVLEKGGSVLSFSDSDGTVIEPNGFSPSQVEKLREIKAMRGRVKDYVAQSSTAKFYEGQRPWRHLDKVDIAFPCATENEVDLEDAKALIAAGCKVVGEGANMPSTPEAIEAYQQAGVAYYPAKAANAGGVACSGLEMAQNSQKLNWTREQVDAKLLQIMEDIYMECRETAAHLGSPNDFQLGANAAGFRKVADAMFEQGAALPFDGRLSMPKIKMNNN